MIHKCAWGLALLALCGAAALAVARPLPDPLPVPAATIVVPVCGPDWCDQTPTPEPEPTHP